MVAKRRVCYIEVLFHNYIVLQLGIGILFHIPRTLIYRGSLKQGSTVMFTSPPILLYKSKSNFVTLKSHIFVSFQHITLIFNVTSLIFLVLFPVMLIDCHQL